jgi:hypothetical protein
MQKYRQHRDTPWYVGLRWEVTESAAFKSLSPAAVWLFVHFSREATKGSPLRIILPFGHVSFKLTWAAFSKARAELVHFGFVVIIEHGGGPLPTDFRSRKPNIYAMSEKWRAVSFDLEKPDNPAGRTIRRWKGAGIESGVWLPTKQARTNNNLVAENLSRKRLARQKKSRPTKQAVIRASQKRGKA